MAPCDPLPNGSFGFRRARKSQWRALDQHQPIRSVAIRPGLRQVHQERVIGHDRPARPARRRGGRLARYLVPARGRLGGLEPELLETDVDRPLHLAFLHALRSARWRTPIACGAIARRAPRLFRARRRRVFVFERAPKPLQFENQRSALRSQSVPGRISRPPPHGSIEMLCILSAPHGQTPSVNAARRAALASGVGAAGVAAAFAAGSG